MPSIAFARNRVWATIYHGNGKPAYEERHSFSLDLTPLPFAYTQLITFLYVATISRNQLAAVQPGVLPPGDARQIAQHFIEWCGCTCFAISPSSVWNIASVKATSTRSTFPSFLTAMLNSTKSPTPGSPGVLKVLSTPSTGACGWDRRSHGGCGWIA